MSSQQMTSASLPTLLTEFEKLLILWAQYPEQCDQKRLVRLNHDVCLALSTISQKPAAYSTYLRTVLQIIKTPIRQSQPIPWDTIHSHQHLSSLREPRKLRKVILHVSGSSKHYPEPGDLSDKLEGKRKFVEISTQASKHANNGVKEEDADIQMQPGPSQKLKSIDDADEPESSDPASVMTEQCSYCFANDIKRCEKTGAQGACSACGTARVRCSMKDRVNDYWKTIGKIGRRSQSRSRSRAASEGKTPQPRQQRKSLPRSGAETGDESESESKPAKRARITPTSRINDLEVVVDDLKRRLCAADAKLATFMQLDKSIGPPDLSSILIVEEERAREREVERQERAAERTAWEARGHEHQAMSDIVTHLWETFRTSNKAPVLMHQQPNTLSVEEEAVVRGPGTLRDLKVTSFETISSTEVDMESRVDDFNIGDVIGQNIEHEKDSGEQLHVKSGNVEVENISTNFDVPDQARVQPNNMDWIPSNTTPAVMREVVEKPCGDVTTINAEDCIPTPFGDPGSTTMLRRHLEDEMQQDDSPVREQQVDIFTPDARPPPDPSFPLVVFDGQVILEDQDHGSCDKGGMERPLPHNGENDGTVLEFAGDPERGNAFELDALTSTLPENSSSLGDSGNFANLSLS